MIASDGGYRTGQGRADASVMEECARSGKIYVCVCSDLFSRYVESLQTRSYSGHIL